MAPLDAFKLVRGKNEEQIAEIKERRMRRIPQVLVNRQYKVGDKVSTQILNILLHKPPSHAILQ